MTITTASSISRFDPASVAALDEPVRRYLTHAIRAGSEVRTSMRLRMRGRIDVGRWVAFTAEQEIDEHSFTWRARAGWGPFKPLRVVDSYAEGAGSTEGKVLGLVRFMYAADENTARAAAGRAAVERLWAPGTLLPGPDVHWRAEADDRIVARLTAPPERPEITLRIDETGAVRDVSVMRWGNASHAQFGYLPFGGTVGAERRFGDLVLPSEISVGWGFGTPSYKPFFKATILDAAPQT